MNTERWLKYSVLHTVDSAHVVVVVVVVVVHALNVVFVAVMMQAGFKLFI